MDKEYLKRLNEMKRYIEALEREAVLRGRMIKAQNEMIKSLESYNNELQQLLEEFPSLADEMDG